MKDASERNAPCAYDALAGALLAEAPPKTIAGAAGSDAEIAAGVAVYRNNVRSAYLGVLRDTFPVVERLVGEEFYRYLAHEYFHARRPSSPLVREYGRGLPAFIESFGAAASLPYLADVARIEIAWLDAYHAPDATPAPLHAFYEALGRDPENAALEMHPSLRLLSSPFPAFSIWRHNREEVEGALKLPPGGENIVIVRPFENVETFAVSDSVFEVFRALADGASLGAALGAADAAESDLTAIIRAIAESMAVIAVNETC